MFIYLSIYSNGRIGPRQIENIRDQIQKMIKENFKDMYKELW